MLKAVLFDFDGTVVNSLKHIHPVWKEALARQGVVVSDEELVSHVYYATQEERQERYGVDGEQLHTDFRELIAKVHNEYEKNTGIDEVLEELKKRGVKTAIVTLGHAEMVKKILQRLGLDGMFEVVLGGKDAGRPKPHPDIALKALELLAAKPEEALLVGDSIMDIQTGKNAGVLTGLYSPEHNASFSNAEILRQSAPDFVFTDFADLLGHIDRIF